MQFQPKTEKEVQEAQLAPIGEYDFEVLAAEDTKSKQQNEMIKISIGIYNGDAMRWRLFDYLLAAMEAKLRHFCDTTGLLAKYEDGTLCAADCKGRAGRVKLGVEKDDTGQYPPKNKVVDYICRPAKPLTAPPKAPSADKPMPNPDDDVPF